MELLQTSALSVWDFVTTLGIFVVSRTIDNISEVVTVLRNGGAGAPAAILPLMILIAQVIILLSTLKVLRMLWTLLHEVRFVWQRPKSYSILHEGGGGKRILVIGDSTAYGTGADRPEDTISGRLAHDFPRTNIINTAVNGSFTKDAIDQLHRAGPGKSDLIIISTGGNDIWRFTPLASLERDLGLLLTEALGESDHRVILLFYANFGGAPLFPAAIRFVLRKRTEQVREVFGRVAATLQVPIIELYTSKQIHEFTPNPFFNEPEKYYAKDRMHPNSEGYRLWYNYMWSEMVARNFTFKEEVPSSL